MHIVQWAIRRATVTTLLRNIKNISSIKDKKEKRNKCTGWVEHEDLMYDASIDKLRCPQLFQFVVTNADGSIVIRPGVLKLWTAYGDKFKPTKETDGDGMGLAWHIWDKNDTTLNVMGTKEEKFNVITFEDIVDVTYQYLDKETTQCLLPNVQRMFHTRCGTVGKYMIVSIRSDFGFCIHILSCCLSCYDEVFIALQHILLYLQTKAKLKAAVEPHESSKRVKKASVVMAAALMTDDA
jgi:hypothetical protein